MHKIPGTCLIGFADFFSTDDVGVAKGQPPKVTPYPRPKFNPAIEKHGKVLTAARKTATTAVQKVVKAAQLLKKPVVKPVHVGAVVAAQLTPKQKAAVAKRNVAAKKASDATKVLAQHVSRAHGSVATLAKAMVTQKKVATKLRPKSAVASRVAVKPKFTQSVAARKTMPAGKAAVRVGDLMNDDVIGAEVKAALNDYYTMVGADPDPSNPGFLTDGSNDPAYWGTGTTSTAPPDPNNPGFLTDGTPDPAYGGGDGGFGIPLTDDPMDTGAALPPAPDMSYQEQDAVAAGGIIYRGEKGTPDGYCGSLGLMTKTTDSYTIGSTPGIDGTDHFGYVWGKFHDNEVPNGVAFGDDFKSNVWIHVRGRHSGAGDYWNVVQPAEAFLSNQKNSPQGKPYGPLVGNPGMPDFARMRVDAKGVMFWYPQEAPDWITFPLKQAAALTAQAAAKAKADADAAAAAALAKVQADAAVAQAAQDAANALAESAATSAANVQQTQTTAQQAADEAAASAQADQALIQQQQADTAEQLLMQQQAQQVAPLLMQQAQQQLQAQQQMLDYARQHPEQVYGGDEVPVDENGNPIDDGTGDTAMPGMETGGGEGEFDDGTVVPGGDVMSDSDGEGFHG